MNMSEKRKDLADSICLEAKELAANLEIGCICTFVFVHQVLLTGGISSKGVLFGVISMSLMLNIADDVCRRFLRLSLACVLVVLKCRRRSDL